MIRHYILSLLFLISLVNCVHNYLECDETQCPVLTEDDCPYGITTDNCDCCDQCLKGPGEYCDHGCNICGEDQTCVDKDCKPIDMESESYEDGTCEEIIKNDCVEEGITPPCSSTCTYGCFADPCDCTTTYCSKTTGDVCSTENECSGRLKCCENQFVYEDGEYVSKPNTCKSVARCGCDVTCEGYENDDPNDVTCPYGKDEKSCSCETKCLKGEGESCGGPNNVEGSCSYAYELRCKNAEGDTIETSEDSSNTETGTCKDWRPPGCTISCKDQVCTLELKYCYYGYDEEQCTCCEPDCLKGPYETCGGPDNVNGKCQQGLTCLELKLIIPIVPGRCVPI